MPFFTRVFRGKDSAAAKKQSKQTSEPAEPPKPKWTDAWLRTEVGPEEVQELLHGCTQELKFRALDIPFLLLPFRPSSDPSAARTFIRNYFNLERSTPLRGEALMQELRLTEPMVLCSVLKWCWGRLPGGVVTWEAYELFKVGEQDSHFARDAFSTFIPISVESDARTKIIFDFFDLLAAIAAHGKSNGLGGRKLSRYAGWWAFEHTDAGNGFDAAYKNWAAAADASSHLFFAYLRSLSPEPGRAIKGISTLPIALQSLVQATEYPPEAPVLLQITTTKVVMIVDTVSPTPFALLRRAKNFEYRDSDQELQEFAAYEDPVRALTDECLRVLRCISSTNQSHVSSTKDSTSLRDASWSRFEDIGFGGVESDTDEPADGTTSPGSGTPGLSSVPRSAGPDLGRPTTPSWADFLSTGFNDENGSMKAPHSLLLPPDKVLPPIGSVRGQSSQSHKRTFDAESSLDPGELANVTRIDLDDSFWWVWISSLSGEEPATRKAVFGRCALIETIIAGAKWLVLEEQVKGAAPEPEPGAYIAEKKRFFGFSMKGRVTRRKSTAKKAPLDQPYARGNNPAPQSKTSIGPDQHARIQAAAAALQKKRQEQEEEVANERRARMPEDAYSTKTNSVMTLQPAILNEASQAMKWASIYDKDAVRSAYLRDTRAGTGVPTDALTVKSNDQSRSASPVPTTTTKGAPPVSPTSPQQKREVTPVAVPAPVAAPAPAPPAKTVEAPNNKDAAEAAAVPLPEPEAPATPVVEQTPEPQRSSTPQPAKEAMSPQSPKSTASTDEHKKLKKKAGNTGFKGIFGSNKKKVDAPPMKPTGGQGAVAAARAALEGRTKAAQEKPGPKPGSYKRLSGFKKKSISESSSPAPESKPVTPKPVEEPKAVEPEPQESQEPQETPTPLPANGPPQTRRDAEYENLSRVNTDEKAAADREFSAFDQGPLVDQPSRTPQDSPVSESFPDTRPSIDTATNGHSSPEPTEPVSPSYDRWSQIRKQAAERAAAQFEAGNRTSITERTDDGDTSGEETIESRVARIKARVAELTGNMEAAR
ncbi:morphogenesis protein (Msb1), putative [Paecilomyces variotii No. 5]|uniref:Morphogenesis protein (Msb1), putative n=1 Tax=Byssochlamys spectabilis (strain No. 5 / NBRC 109023) TaxID=1356009 RepID=V5G8I7_BYSSN|nr:morphogenesis protein (Msb1), putative [Paecilomyces variotii No. 5]